MMYITRDSSGKIDGAYTGQVTDSNGNALGQSIEDNNPELQAYYALMNPTLVTDWDTQIKQYRDTLITRLKDNGSSVIYQQAPIYKQQSASLSLGLINAGKAPLTGYDMAKISTINNWINTVIKIIDQKETELNSKFTKADLDIVDIAYDTILKIAQG